MKQRTGRLEISSSTNEEDNPVLTMSGQIDERSDMVKVVENLAGQVHIDLAGVTFINSIGVREWIKMLRSLEGRKVPVILTRCSETMVMQMNMIIETQTGATVQSFFAPYLCDACGYEGSMCLDIKEHRAALDKKDPPPVPCPECKSAMQFNEIPGRYLLFLEQLPDARVA